MDAPQEQPPHCIATQLLYNAIQRKDDGTWVVEPSRFTKFREEASKVLATPESAVFLIEFFGVVGHLTELTQNTQMGQALLDELDQLLKPEHQELLDKIIADANQARIEAGKGFAAFNARNVGEEPVPEPKEKIPLTLPKNIKG